MILLATTIAGLGIGAGTVLGLSPEAAEMALFPIVMCASFYGFASWLEERSKSRHKDILNASLADYRWVRHG